MGLAALNARQHFSACFDEETRSVDLAKGLAKILHLRQVPRRIECVDISNLQGSDIVGALVAFYDTQPDKDSYRKYLLSFQDKPDDFAAVHEVVLRRLRRGLEAEDLPDLLLIDGGPGQLARALEARNALNVNLEIAALAKERTGAGSKGRAGEGGRPERLYIEGQTEPIELPPANAVTHFVQRIRDEAHRFVITFHRARRARRVLGSVLDTVPGLGAARKTRLFRAFGSIAGMKKVSVEELARAGRMPLMLAQRVRSAIGQ